MKNKQRFTVLEVAPPFNKLPVSGYGPIERIIWSLTTHFTEKSLTDINFPETELWAPGDSQTVYNNISINLVPTVKQSTGIEDNLWNTLMRQIPRDMYQVRERLSYDDKAIAHLHTPLGMGIISGAGKDIAMRTLTTIHSPSEWWMLEFHKDMPVIAISEAQAQANHGYDFMHVIYNGIEDTLYKPKYTLDRDAGFCFIGRLNHEKNPIDAIKIANAVNARIDLAGSSDLNSNQEYMESLNSLITSGNGKARLVGEVKDIDNNLANSKNNFLSNSRALLFPIQWKEPFGMVIAEANACGTPVIAYNYPGSSVNELIKDGVNGYKVNSLEEAVAAAKIIENIDRKLVRKHFEDNFTASRMVERYKNVFVNELPRYWKSIGVIK